MKIIERYSHIQQSSVDEFIKSYKSAVEDFQNQELEVEIMYCPFVIGNTIIYSALINGFKTV